MCRECSNLVCSPRCPYMMESPSVVGHCVKCGGSILDGDEAINIKKLLPDSGLDGLVCEDCVFHAIEEIYLDDLI